MLGFNQIITSLRNMLHDDLQPRNLLFKDELSYKYGKDLLDRLNTTKEIINESQSIVVIKQILSENWSRVKNTSLCYTACPDDRITRILCDLATEIAAKTKQSPIEILMPGVNAESAHDDYPSLDSPEAPELLEIVRTHIVSDNVKYLIPVKILCELPGPLEKDRPLNNYYYDYSTMSEEEAIIKRSELARLEIHSHETRALFETRRQYDLIINNPEKRHLLGHLQELIRGLYMNGAYGGLGVQSNAGSGAYPAIIRFVEFYDTLEQEQKKLIALDVRKVIDRIIELASNSKINIHATSNVETCVADNSKRLESVVKKYELQLAHIGVSDNKQRELLQQAKERFERASKDLSNFISQRKYQGKDALYLTVELLEYFNTAPRIRSKSELDYFLTLPPNEILAITQSNMLLKNALLAQFNSIENFIINIIELSDDRLRIILKIIGNEFVKKNVHDVSDLAALFISLEPSRIYLIMETLGKNLESSLANFSQIQRFLTPEQIDALYRQQVNVDISSFKTWDEFIHFFKKLNEIPQNIFFNNNAKYITLMIDDTKKFSSVYKSLNPDNQKEMLALVPILPMIKSVDDFHTIACCFGPDDKQNLFEFFYNNHMHTIRNLPDYKKFNNCLDYNQRIATYDKLSEVLPSMISSFDELLYVLECLDLKSNLDLINRLDQRFFEMISCVRDIDKLIMKVKDYKYIRKIQLDILRKMPSLIKSLADLRYISSDSEELKAFLASCPTTTLRTLIKNDSNYDIWYIFSGTYNTDIWFYSGWRLRISPHLVFESVVDRLHDIIDDVDQFCIFINCISDVSKDYPRRAIHAMLPHMPRLINNVNQLYEFMSIVHKYNLYSDEVNVCMNAIVSNINTSIQDLGSVCHLPAFQYLIDCFFNAKKHKLPTLIQSAQDFDFLLSYLSDKQREEAYLIMEDRIPSEIHTFEDYTWLRKSLSYTETFTLLRQGTINPLWAVLPGLCIEWYNITRTQMVNTCKRKRDEDDDVSHSTPKRQKIDDPESSEASTSHCKRKKEESQQTTASKRRKVEDLTVIDAPPILNQFPDHAPSGEDGSANVSRPSKRERYGKLPM